MNFSSRSLKKFCYWIVIEMLIVVDLHAEKVCSSPSSNDVCPSINCLFTLSIVVHLISSIFPFLSNSEEKNAKDQRGIDVEEKDTLLRCDNGSISSDHSTRIGTYSQRNLFVVSCRQERARMRRRKNAIANSMRQGCDFNSSSM